jgi:hypothetical protein
MAHFLESGLLVHWPWHATPSSMAEASELLKHRRLRDHRGHLLRCFSLASLVGGALARGDFVEGVPLRFHPNVRAWRVRRGQRCSGIYAVPVLAAFAAGLLIPLRLGRSQKPAQWITE